MIKRSVIIFVLFICTAIAYKLPTDPETFEALADPIWFESSCDYFKCNTDSTCFEVGDSDCDSADCPKTPRCILNGHITCANIRCDGECVMVLQPASYGGTGPAAPQCFPAEDTDDDGSDDNMGDGPSCDNFKCQDDSKCFEVGDATCNSEDCPKELRCILKGQITCDSIQCDGTCIMVHEQIGRKGTPVPFCLTEPEEGYDDGYKKKNKGCQPGVKPPDAPQACILLCIMGSHCVIDPVKGPQCEPICRNSPPVFPPETCATKTKKCGCKEKCFMVNDAPCEGLKCSQHPQCFDKKQFTCDSIRCPDKCVMELEVKGNGHCNPVPKCVTSDDSNTKSPDNKYSEGDDATDSEESYKHKKKL